MALLQVRNFPDEIYDEISKIALRERRSIAKQTILLIESGLANGEAQGERRRRAIGRLISGSTPDGIKNADFAALIREDRDR